MIEMPASSLAVNSVSAPQAHYRLNNYFTVPDTSAPSDVMQWIYNNAINQPGGRFSAIVLNCHGYEVNGQLGYGLAMGTGITHANVACFNKIRGLADTIYITACGAGRIARGHTPGGAGDGHAMLSNIARYARANVIASTEIQIRPPVLPVGFIDAFEGLVVYYNSQGHFDGSVRHRSMWPTSTPGVFYGNQ